MFRFAPTIGRLLLCGTEDRRGDLVVDDVATAKEDVSCETMPRDSVKMQSLVIVALVSADTVRTRCTVLLVLVLADTCPRTTWSALGNRKTKTVGVTGGWKKH